MGRQQRKLTCRECGQEFGVYSGRGSPRELCDSCAPSQTIRKRSDNAPKRPPESDPLEAFQVELMAIGLSGTDDVKEAARQAGLDVTKAKAKKLAEAARERFPELIELQSSALGKNLRQAIGVVTIRARALANQADIRVLGQLTQTLTRAMDLVQGGAQSTYHPISIVVQGPDGGSVTVGGGGRAGDAGE